MPGRACRRTRPGRPRARSGPAGGRWPGGPPPARRRSGRPGRPGTRSARWSAGPGPRRRTKPVAGCSARSTGTHSSRSAKDRSDEQLPVAGQPVQVVDVGRAERGVLLGEVTQGGHGASVAQSVRSGHSVAVTFAARAGRPGPRPGPAPGPGRAAAAAGCPAAGRSRSSTAGTARCRAPPSTSAARPRPGRPGARRAGSAPRRIDRPPGPEPTTASTGTSGVGHRQRAVQQVGAGERERRPGTRSPSASAPPPGRSGRRTRGRW